MYVEFAIVGPHGTREKRQMMLSGGHVTRDGHTTIIEILGPKDFETYLGSCEVMATMVEMFRCMDPATWHI